MIVYTEFLPILGAEQRNVAMFYCPYVPLLISRPVIEPKVKFQTRYDII